MKLRTNVKAGGIGMGNSEKENTIMTYLSSWFKKSAGPCGMFLLLTVAPIYGQTADGMRVSGAAAARTDTVEPSKSFASEDEMLSWIATRARELGIGETTVHQDAQGRTKSVVLTSVGDHEKVDAAETQLIHELGGSDGRMLVGGKRMRVRDSAGKTETTPQALSNQAGAPATEHGSGEFRTDDWSFKNNYFLYRSIGSQTNQVSGGFRWEYKVVWGYTCPAGYKLYGGLGFGYISCRRGVGGNVLSIDATFYNFLDNGLLLEAGRRSGFVVNSTSLEVKHWEWGTGGGWVADLDGVCARHMAWGDGGSSSATTYAGSVPEWCRLEAQR